MSDSVYGFVGFGLIGGSIARSIKRAAPSSTIMACSRSQKPLSDAKNDGVVDLILPGLCEDLSRCDIIFLCAPVGCNIDYLPQIRPFLRPGAILTDIGSTKTAVQEAAEKEGINFIGGHPMAGSEKTGYENSTDHLLENAYYVITPGRTSRPMDITRMIDLVQLIGAMPVVLDCREHDRIVAAVSHLPHLIASSLVNLIKASDNENEMMKRLAAGGFKDITRIASSSPVMWEQICMSNADNIVELLDDYILSLQKVKEDIAVHNGRAINQLFDDSRAYRSTFRDTGKGLMAPDFSFTADVVDEPGAISTLAAILSARGINIVNIGINHNREHGEGVLRVSFADRQSMDAAWDQLLKFNYKLIKVL